MTHRLALPSAFWPAVSLALVCLAYVWIGLYYGNRLPDEVASHFNLMGEADGWSPWSEFMAFFWIIGGVMLAIMLGMSYGIAVLPESIYNLPNKEYWFDASRKEATLNWWKKHMLWFGVGIMGLLTFLFYETFEFSMGNGEKAIPALYLILIFGVFVWGWVMKLIKQFTLPDEGTPSL